MGEKPTISRSEGVTITKKLTRTGRTVVLAIPKDIVDLLELDTDTVVEATIKKFLRAPVVVEKVALK